MLASTRSHMHAATPAFLNPAFVSSLYIHSAAWAALPALGWFDATVGCVPDGRPLCLDTVRIPESDFRAAMNHNITSTDHQDIWSPSITRTCWTFKQMYFYMDLQWINYKSQHHLHLDTNSGCSGSPLLSSCWGSGDGAQDCGISSLMMNLCCCQKLSRQMLLST